MTTDVTKIAAFFIFAAHANYRLLSESEFQIHEEY